MSNCEILSIGTELLLGDVLDTNSQYLAIELARIGIDSYVRTTVGDNKERIQKALREALNRSDLVITTGGLGPTADDLTTECIANFFDAELVLDEAVLARIEEFFSLRQVKMPRSNRKQALKPAQAAWLPNPSGTAPGLIWEVAFDLLEKAKILNADRARTILTFPGVPSELKIMWDETARSYLATKYNDGAIWSCELKHFGIGESALAEKFDHMLTQSNPTVAPYAGRGECRLRVTAKAGTISDAKSIAAPTIDEIKKESGIFCYGIDNDTLESVVGSLLNERGWSLSCAESCTGGYLTKRLTDVAGSSQYIGLSVVTYSNDSKAKLLAVPQLLLLEKGAVSGECAIAMATGVRRLAGSDIGVSITGIAGPGGGTAEKPVGLVYFALAASGFRTVREVRFSERLSRQEIRFRCVNEALNMVRTYLIAPQTLKNESAPDHLSVHYSITVNRGTLVQHKVCELDSDSMPEQEADKLSGLIKECGVLRVDNKVVWRAGNLIGWKLTVTDSEGDHIVSSKAGEPDRDSDEQELDLSQLLDFLNPYLEEQ